MVRINKKGMDISLNFIILAVLALIALIIIALFFTGGLTNLFGQTEDVASISSEKIALYNSKCAFYCTTDDKSAWDNPSLSEEFTNNGITTCDQLLAKYDPASAKVWETNPDTQELECKSKSA